MKTTTIFYLIAIILTVNSCKKNVPHLLNITLQPGTSNGKDAEIFSCVQCGYNNQNFGASKELSAIAWTNGGAVSNARGLIEFDLSAIPAKSLINNAKLSLYYNPTSTNGNDTALIGTNACLLKRITENWTRETVTWDNQPQTTEINKVILPQSTTSNQNYLDINVTALVADMINNPTQSFGFMLKLETEEFYRRLIFASSDNPDLTLHPKLEITYTSK